MKIAVYTKMVNVEVVDLASFYGRHYLHLNASRFKTERMESIEE